MLKAPKDIWRLGVHHSSSVQCQEKEEVGIAAEHYMLWEPELDGRKRWCCWGKGMEVWWSIGLCFTWICYDEGNEGGIREDWRWRKGSAYTPFTSKNHSIGARHF